MIKFLLLFLIPIYAYSFSNNKYFKNMRNNQVLMNSNIKTINSNQSVAMNRVRNVTVPKSTLQKPIVHGRFYLAELFNSIYQLDEYFLFDNLYSQMIFFGDPCDPLAQNYYELNNDNTGKLKCFNDVKNMKLRKDSNLIREGWKINICKILNKNFSNETKPLSLIFQMFNSTEINDRSIKYAYHLFNPFIKIPDKAMELLFPLYTQQPFDRTLRSKYLSFKRSYDDYVTQVGRIDRFLEDSGLSAERREKWEGERNKILRKKEFEFKSTENISKENRWELIFYSFCIDQNNKIL